jgi:O-antigen/teichoic acid export membrane protein
VSAESIAWPRVPSLLRPLVADSLVRNSILLMGTTIVNSGLGYAYWVLAAHLFPVHVVGLSTAIISAFMLLSQLSNMGAHSALVDLLPKRAAGRDWSRTINAGLGTGILTGLVAAVVGILVLPLIAPSLDVLRSPLLATLFTVGVILTTVNQVVDFAFVAERSSGKMLLRNTVFAIVKLALLAVVPLAAPLSATDQIIGTWVLALVASMAAAYFVLIPRLRRAYGLHLRGLGVEMRRILRSLVSQHLINLGGTIPMYALPLVVTARLSATDNAYFYTTWMVGSLFFMISAWVAVSLFAEGSHDPGALTRRMRASIRLITLLVVPSMIVMVLAGMHILSLFGSSYTAGYGLLLVLTASAIPDGITNLYVSVLRIGGRVRTAAALNIGMALVTLGLGWLLLPPLGIIGGGVAWLVAEVLGSLWTGWDILRRRRLPRLAAA